MCLNSYGIARSNRPLLTLNSFHSHAINHRYIPPTRGMSCVLVLRDGDVVIGACVLLTYVVSCMVGMSSRSCWGVVRRSTPNQISDHTTDKHGAVRTTPHIWSPPRHLVVR